MVNQNKSEQRVIDFWFIRIQKEWKSTEGIIRRGRGALKKVVGNVEEL